MTTIVKSRAMRGKGEILGMKTLSYQTLPPAMIRLNLVIMPAWKDMPR